MKSSLGPSISSKPTTYQTSASSLVPSVQKSSVLPIPAQPSVSAQSIGSSGITRTAPSSQAFYPSAASAPGPSFDKSRFSSLYGTNGFTAKAGPLTGSHQAKSSKSLKASISPTMETQESQSVPFQPITSSLQRSPSLMTSFPSRPSADAINAPNHKPAEGPSAEESHLSTSSEGKTTSSEQISE